MKLSVVFAVRNEHPALISTMFSFWEDLVPWSRPGVDFEFVVVDNCSTDSTAAILRDRFRRWIKHKFLRVIEYDERPANVVARTIGAEDARGDVVIHADGHLSIASGTTQLLYEGATKGGCWHPAHNKWHDMETTRCYGYDLKLREKFWGNLSTGVPKSVQRDARGRPEVPYPVPMASHCCLAVRRDEFLKLGGYGKQLRVYGGGEPLLNMKYWTTGRQVIMEPRAFVRHAFGLRTIWQPVDKDTEKKSEVLVRRGGRREEQEFSKELRAGDSYLRDARDYAWTNEDVHHNFMAAAYIVGGYEWLQHMYAVYWKIRAPNERYLDDLKKLRREVLAGCEAERQALAAQQTTTLDALLAAPPWPT